MRVRDIQLLLALRTYAKNIRVLFLAKSAEQADEAKMASVVKLLESDDQLMRDQRIIDEVASKYPHIHICYSERKETAGAVEEKSLEVDGDA
jgi:hypothetical protein